jgi:YfiR/HmsC-like
VPGCPAGGEHGEAPARVFRFVLRIFIALMLLAPGRAFLRAQTNSERAGEYQVKAAFLYNFAKFVEWPPDALPNEHSPIVIGILGEDPFGRVLDQAVLGKNINGHELQIARAKSLEELKGCQIIFISSSERKRLLEILATLRGADVLTVGEAEGFAPSGGIIQLVLRDNRVRLMVNVEAAERARLKISSKLLALAEIVRDEPRRGGS